jgi:hypothetical protein
MYGQILIKIDLLRNKFRYILTQNQILEYLNFIFMQSDYSQNRYENFTQHDNPITIKIDLQNLLNMTQSDYYNQNRYLKFTQHGSRTNRTNISSPSNRSPTQSNSNST